MKRRERKQQPRRGKTKLEYRNGVYLREFAVEQILDRKMLGGKPLYQVKWKSYPITEATWEPLDHLTGVQELVDAFESAFAARSVAKSVSLSEARNSGKRSKPASESNDNGTPSSGSRAKATSSRKPKQKKRLDASERSGPGRLWPVSNVSPRRTRQRSLEPNEIDHTRLPQNEDLHTRGAGTRLSGCTSKSLSNGRNSYKQQSRANQGPNGTEGASSEGNEKDSGIQDTQNGQPIGSFDCEKEEFTNRVASETNTYLQPNSILESSENPKANVNHEPDPGFLDSPEFEFNVHSSLNINGDSGGELPPDRSLKMNSGEAIGSSEDSKATFCQRVSVGLQVDSIIGTCNEEGRLDNDTPLRIENAYKLDDHIVCRMSWKPRANGQVPLSTAILAPLVKEKYPLLLLDFYESVVNLQHFQS